MFIAMLCLSLLVSLLCSGSLAYIPATPTNDNQMAVNQTDKSRLLMKWFPGVLNMATVSYQLAKQGSDGYAEGALVHFTEDNLIANDTTSTPWIAFINCDDNSTTPSMDVDIFTLARDRGALAALLYSENFEACLINPEYASPDNFEQILDIYATQSKSSAQLIASQFQNLRNASYSSYSSAMLNSSQSQIAVSMYTANVTAGYIVSSLRAENSTVPMNGTGDSSGNGSNNSLGSSSSNPNTGLAMIVLYAITGCVSALFIIVILSGAIRAIRHPERYGPRAANPNAPFGATPARSRTAGLGRAILDTFPIIKFGHSTDDDEPSEQAAPPPKPADDVEAGSGPEHIMMKPLSPTQDAAEVPPTEENGEHEKSSRNSPIQASAVPRESSERDGASSSAAPRHSVEESVKKSETAAEGTIPAGMGRETCPICIIDFEDGDDLRVLPCEGKHRFHQNCVDPWLLELSTSCPLCREDFHALQTMAEANDEQEQDGPSPQEGPSSSSAPPDTQANRRQSFFARLKAARRRPRGTELDQATTADNS